MIIDQLPEISSVQTTDEMPVERGQTAYKTPVSKIFASPTLTGTPKAPTAGVSTDNTQIATTAFANRAANNAANNAVSTIGIVQNGNTATQNISKGQYVIWHGALYTASTAIASGDTLSNSNLTAVTGGGLNNLMSSIGDYIGPFMSIPLFSGNTRANYNAIRLTLNGNDRGSIFVFCVNGNGTPYCFAVSYPNDLSAPTVTTVYGSATTATTDSTNHTITIKLGYGYVFMALACNATKDGTWSYVNVS